VKKSKSITLLNGLEGEDWWKIVIVISNIGKFINKGQIKYKDDIFKAVTLISGHEEGNYWKIYSYIRDDGSMGSLNNFYLEDIETKILSRKCSAEYHKIHKRNRIIKKKTLHLGKYYIDNFAIELQQGISSEGKVYGTGGFYCIRTSEVSKRFYRNHIAKDMVLLNDYFSESELHHLSNVYGIYIPKDLHRGISHNLKTGRNMITINKKALKYWNLNINKNKEANCFK